MAWREGVELYARAGGKRQGMCPGAGCRWGRVCTRAQCKGQGGAICAAAQCEVRAVCSVQGRGGIHHGSVQGLWVHNGSVQVTRGTCAMAQCEGRGRAPWLGSGSGDVHHGSVQGVEDRVHVTWLSAREG